MDLTEHPVHESELFKGGFLHARRDRVRLPDGSLTEREYILHPGAVMIIPLLERAGGTLEVVLERQYRYPVQRTLIEFPAGKLDPGESALACARRELREETGYVARQWARAGVLHPVVSYSTEVIEIWFARHLVSGERALDAGEFLEVFSATPAQLQAWCRGGEVTDAKTLVGALWLQNVLGGAWPLTWQDVPAT
ncbi:MAG TPA: NUDIX hydrolase [Ottowia sp.]|nr:NUDIX hydrolase [Ottowia sp.]